jgi:hypothetical protein
MMLETGDTLSRQIFWEPRAELRSPGVSPRVVSDVCGRVRRCTHERHMSPDVFPHLPLAEGSKRSNERQ